MKSTLADVSKLTFLFSALKIASYILLSYTCLPAGRFYYSSLIKESELFCSLSSFRLSYSFKILAAA